MNQPGDDLVPDGPAQTFVQALRRVEDEGDVEDMATLFGDDAQLRRVGNPATRTGPDGARRFWREYREMFSEITSRFTDVRAGGDQVVLEWTARARTRAGSALSYDGVSLLDLGPAGGLRGFRTYYDTAAFVDAPSGRA